MHTTGNPWLKSWRKLGKQLMNEKKKSNNNKILKHRNNLKWEKYYENINTLHGQQT